MVSTNAAGYIARAREWGLVEPKQSKSRYQLTPFGVEQLIGGEEMTTDKRNIVERALGVRTLEEATAVQDLIASAIGARHQRPLGDRWNNQGILTGSGASYDHKALEVVTNMQDAVLELAAIRKYGSREDEDTPFKNPHDAAESSLLAGLDRRSKAELATVTIDRAGVGSDKKRVTLVTRDFGCGIAAAGVPRGIFCVGAKNKDGIDWQQGTFGLGGATTYRNAQAVVLVTRRHPDLLESGQRDLITVAVVLWERHRTTTNAYYLVTEEVGRRRSLDMGKSAAPFDTREDIPDFEPGTHLALVGYDTAGFSRRSGDEKSFDTVLNTRLFRPVLPINYRNNLTRPDRCRSPRRAGPPARGQSERHSNRGGGYPPVQPQRHNVPSADPVLPVCQTRRQG